MNYTEFDEREFVDGHLIVCHSGSGRLIAPYSLLKKLHGKTPSTNMIRGISPEATKKGFINEKLFQTMFNELVSCNMLPTGYRVLKASRNQDERFKVDFWIDVRFENENTRSIPIQIKSSRYGRDKFIKKFGDKVAHIYVVVMNAEMTRLRLMRRILSIVEADQIRHGDIQT
jgi:hypothetical protein